MKLLNLIKSLILGRSWIFILVLGLISAGSAGIASWKLKGLIDNQRYSVLENEYSQYKLNVSNSVNAENTATINKMSNLMDSLKTFQLNFQKQQAANKEFSDSLIKELYEANGKSCPLSPAI